MLSFPMEQCDVVSLPVARRIANQSQDNVTIVNVLIARSSSSLSY